MKRKRINKKLLTVVIIAAALFIAIIVLIVVLATRPRPKPEEKKEQEPVIEEEIPEEPTGPVIEVIDGITYANGVMIVNKKYGLPEDYSPGEDPEAIAALRELIAAAQAEGLDIGNEYSGYRSYSRQSELYWTYVERDGQAEADTYSARPGFSEHQTGLAYDLKNWDGSLVETEPEALWIAQNAHRFGFIVRYKAEKQSITGYVDETWHIRYVGSIATDIYNSGLCLEEYLGVEGGDYIE